MHQEIEISIEKPVYGGLGLAFYKGKAVFVQLGIPGETYNVKIVKETKDYYKAEIIDILERSTYREEPRCPNFILCGGCSYMNVTYNHEIEIKKSIIIDNLRRIAKLSEEKIPTINIITGERYNYRSHCEIKNENGKMGFFQRNSNTLVPFPAEGCAILSGKINSLLNRTKSNKKTIKFACSYNGNCISTESKLDKIFEKIDNYIIERSIHSFFQANQLIRKDMLEKVNEYASLNINSTFLDMHCGVGFFTIFLSQNVKTGYGFDINKKSVDQAKNNAAMNNINNLYFKAIPSWDINFSRYAPDAIILDPPRSGLDKKTRRTVLAFDASKIVYVSCNPATFARDVKDIVQGGYSFEELTLIDMFPCTQHIEVISKLIKVK